MYKRLDFVRTLEDLFYLRFFLAIIERITKTKKCRALNSYKAQKHLGESMHGHLVTNYNSFIADPLLAPLFKQLIFYCISRLAGNRIPTVMLVQPESYRNSAYLFTFWTLH